MTRNKSEKKTKKENVHSFEHMFKVMSAGKKRVDRMMDVRIIAKNKEENDLKFRCGHENDYVRLTDDEIINAYMNWSEIVAIGGDRSECFNCFFARKRKK